MGYAAIDCLEDAVDASRAFLLPFDRGRWLRLAVVVLFLSGAGTSSLPNVTGQVGGFQSDVDVGPVVDGGEVTLPSVPAEVWALLLALAGAASLVAAVFVLVGSVMEFVLVDALRRERVTVRASFRRYLRAGLTLFGFRVLLGVAAVVPLALLGVALFGPVVTGGVGAAWLALAIVLFVVGALAVGLVAAVVHGLTVEFVVPVMVAKSCGIIAGWRRLWPTVRTNLGEVAVYVVVRFALAIGVGIVAGTVTGVLGLIVLVPLGIVGGGLWIATGAAVTPVAVVGLVLLLFVLVLGLVAVAAVVEVPLKTYTRYYELLVLGDLAPEFDLVGDRRAAVRDE